eukprot:TRINITY_DN13788_c0_g2_i1.p2 TRINITY_DN13788_c0_g2~~TRINITY_DN13788_c0_g2_i1.p2  ORF type:complete len:113 (+),score=13.55 TRINITY_DN13788_c0_g2_i1:600-938(+)
MSVGSHLYCPSPEKIAQIQTAPPIAGESQPAVPKVLLQNPVEEDDLFRSVLGSRSGFGSVRPDPLCKCPVQHSANSPDVTQTQQFSQTADLTRLTAKIVLQFSEQSRLKIEL